MAQVTKGADTRLRKALDDIRLLAGEMAKRSSFHVAFVDFHIMSADQICEWRDIVREEINDVSYVLPTELVDIYRLTGGFDFRWTCDADSGSVGGAIMLSSLPELYLRDAEADVAMKQSMAEWRRFDSISPNEFTALRLDRGSAGLQCVYFKDGHPIRLNVSPSDYLVAAADHLGILKWQTKDMANEEKIVRDLAEWE